MPVELSYSEMDCDVSPRSKLHGIERMGSEDSGFGSRSRNSNLDDDFMNYMSHEEQECILFFETTLDSLKDDFEESSSVCSVKSEDPSTPTQIHSGNEEIIDLVVARPQASERVAHYENVLPVEKDIGEPQKEEVRANQEKMQLMPPERPRPTINAAQFLKQRSFERTPPESEIEPARAFYNLAKPPGSVPTPMVIAQKIAEKKAGNGITSPVSPAESKRFTYENDQMNSTSPTEGQEFHYRNAKLQRFPSNISISMASREYNNTITKAAVKVQERKAQVLANLGGTSLLVAELDDQQQKAKPRRSLSFKEAVSIQTRDEALSKLGLVEESDETDSNSSDGFKSKVRNSTSAQSMKVPSVTNGTHAAGPLPVTPPLKAPSPKPEPKEIPHPSTKLNMSGIHRSRSIQKPSGFRSQGVTVQFSGRGSTDESRKEALRKLGLLRINEVQ
ncbi:proline and serine-rich protein 2-like [Mustelus asterias]